MKIHNPFRVALVATLGVGLGILLIGSLQSLSTILLYVGTALFISLGLDPVVSWLERRRLPRWAAVLITLVLVLGVFAGIVWIILPTLIQQVSQLVRQITIIVNGDTWQEDIRGFLTDTFPGLMVDDIFDQANQWLLDNIATISESVLGATLGVVNGLFGVFIVLILTIYLTASTPSLKNAVYQLVPASQRESFIGLADQITDSVGYYVMGQVTLGVINGVLSAIFLTIIDAPFPAVLAVVAFLGSLIPLVGTISASAIIVLTCLIPNLGSTTTAIIAAIYYLVYMQIEAYVVSPRVMSRAVSVPGGVVVVAALAGGALLGLLGALIAIPVAASVLIIYRQVVIPRMNER
ncbi:AI-2E family transporter [Microbacterium sediminis]|uniref:AI-2E family transporter n=1 Tax=Microbacterium sediminis TaxID=904291 RepID=A0A1B9NF63_9MICO|nr:AI-2E family transporter [Microbacterium sediminis]OCG75242.1 AI-2E family transporter [Microbacterium sediminis]QBR74257.1 AI-2E family transporter [Microbacterium sediminis]